MKTKRLFREDVYMKDGIGKVTGVFPYEDYCLVTLDQTIFFPTGGGQSCDVGSMNQYQVVEVYEENQDIYHRIVGEDIKLSIGDIVQLSIDWSHRFDNMQRHCGEHILSGMFHQEFGGINRGFHMGDEYMTIDISLEEKPEFTCITWDMAKQVEWLTNQAIWANLPVITRHFDRREEAEVLPLRKALAFEKDITIVSVGDTSNPSDCVACCGTHPSTSGQVGLLKIYKIEPNKGMFRIYFEAGNRAFSKYQNQFDTLSAIENKLSAGTGDLLDKYQAQQEKMQDIKDQLYHIKKSLISSEIDLLRNDTSKYIVKKYDKLSIDDLLAVGRALTSHLSGIAFLIHAPTNTVLLFSSGNDKFDCGKLVKDNASIYNGKGGGNKTSARVFFPNLEYAQTFVELIQKHLL